jgi:hemerythrin
MEFDSDAPDLVSAPAALAHLAWQPAFASGNVRIDLQHRALMNAVNDLIDASASEPRELVIARVDELISHTLHHFRDEEAVLQRSGYPKVNEHARARAGLIGKMLGLRERVQEDPALIRDLVAFMADIVVSHHLTEVDKKYFG